MKNIILSIVMLSLLLSFGCVNDNTPQDTDTTADTGADDTAADTGTTTQDDTTDDTAADTGTTTQDDTTDDTAADTGTTTQDDTGADATDTTTDDTTPADEDENAQDTTSTITDDVDNMAYSALIALGTPVKCTYTQDTATSEMYIKGNKLYVETTMEGYEGTIEMIMKDNKTYMKLNDELKSSMPGAEECDWFMYDLATMTDSSAAPGSADTYDTPDFTIDSNCVIDTFGDEKFETTGKVCDYTELLNSMISS